MKLTDHGGEKAETGSSAQTIPGELRLGVSAVFRCRYASKQPWSNPNQIKVILTLTTSDPHGEFNPFYHSRLQLTQMEFSGVSPSRRLSVCDIWEFCGSTVCGNHWQPTGEEKVL